MTNFPPPVLSVKNLTLALPAGSERANAVEDATFEVLPGEITCIVGESGSGKSTTAFAVMGLNAPEISLAGGEIWLQNDKISHAPPKTLRQLRGVKMAMIFQEPMTALDPTMKIGDQIAESLCIHTKLTRAQRQQLVKQTLENVNLPDPERIISAYPHQLSGGQRQRVMIAGALILNPALLIADEPTTALDVTTQAQILKLIRDLKHSCQAGILFITHDIGVVAEIADRVIVMRYGRIVEQGSVGEVLRHPQNPYTQMLIACAPSKRPPARKPIVAPNVLTIDRLNKIYRDSGLFQKKRSFAALKDASIHIASGEILGIVGESGSGKSTLARCIIRLLKPSTGAMVLEGCDYAQLHERKLRMLRQNMAIVFQDPYRSLNPRRTIAQSLVEAPMNFGSTYTQALQQAREKLELVGLDVGALERFPHQFSGGQRQRICIARALAQNPKVLIADEAVSALDVSVQAKILDLLDDIRQKFRLAILFITHDLRVAAQICDRVAVMRAGEVVEQGFTQEIFANPQNDYTKALFAAAPDADFAPERS